jgi:hypothetical protein
MGLAVEAPAREDLSFRTNDDKLVGARWLKADGVTPVVLTAASLTLLSGAGPSEVHIIDSANSTTPGDPVGWIDATQLAAGTVLATVPHGIWSMYVMRGGAWDIVAIGEGKQRCLVRGTFIAEEGIST